ncbi:hypothetical protein ASPZODRAFT_66371 [Penicilliopsis zonata CBS 506.65]|uniref:Zn(2)-C6 fungal-type domain-containing protein n=1 Tax=Penicilliopsis zonata CBS 506.65 TaxID=1073090 RepID=A0A1L9SH23_9EURO|nr:hypothetical protein ASPZODRAFT_66371 [Penicilliopsis zonata CBS 506.65]OJJ46492.1 hypothetical protein ASPZODRAFT_66371 [Penicilliopsis zonata CBS 506.65]
MPAHVNHPPAPPRRRAQGTRSRRGCRTCRARHVKCDETPESCTNCTSTGRSCDGYDKHEVPQERAGKLRLCAEIATAFRWRTTSDERRALSLFQHLTVPALIAVFDSSLWQRLVLQMSHGEPAVYHAVVALSAIHQASEVTIGSMLARQRRGPPAEQLHRASVWRRFGIEQLGRSLAALNQRSMSQDPQLREVTLLCCLLFIVGELLQNHHDAASQHLLSGVSILCELRRQESGRKPTALSPVEPALFTTFLRLEMQYTHMGNSIRLMCLADSQPEQKHLFSPPVFHTLEEARQAFDPINSAVFRFQASTWTKSPAEMAAAYPVLLAMKHDLLSRLDWFWWSFEAFYHQNHPFLGPKEQRSIDMLHLHYTAAVLSVKVTMHLHDWAVLDPLEAELKHLLLLAESMVDRFPDRPALVMDLGVMPPLYIVAIACSDLRARWRAIELLRVWPHWEGSWNSILVSSIAAEHVKAYTIARPDVFAGTQSSVMQMQMQDELRLVDALQSVRSMRNWVCVQSFSKVL